MNDCKYFCTAHNETAVVSILPTQWKCYYVDSLNIQQAGSCCAIIVYLVGIHFICVYLMYARHPLVVCSWQKRFGRTARGICARLKERWWKLLHQVFSFLYVRRVFSENSSLIYLKISQIITYYGTLRSGVPYNAPGAQNNC